MKQHFWLIRHERFLLQPVCLIKDNMLTANLQPWWYPEDKERLISAAVRRCGRLCGSQTRLPLNDEPVLEIRPCQQLFTCWQVWWLSFQDAAVNLCVCGVSGLRLLVSHSNGKHSKHVNGNLLYPPTELCTPSGCSSSLFPSVLLTSENIMLSLTQPPAVSHCCVFNVRRMRRGWRAVWGVVVSCQCTA